MIILFIKLLIALDNSYQNQKNVLEIQLRMNRKIIYHKIVNWSLYNATNLQIWISHYYENNQSNIRFLETSDYSPFLGPRILFCGYFFLIFASCCMMVFKHIKIKSMIMLIKASFATHMVNTWHLIQFIQPYLLEMQLFCSCLS